MNTPIAMMTYQEAFQGLKALNEAFDRKNRNRQSGKGWGLVLGAYRSNRRKYEARMEELAKACKQSGACRGMWCNHEVNA